MNIFWRYEDFFWIFLGGHHKIRLVLGVISMHLESFLRSRYRIGIFFGVAKISNIFIGRRGEGVLHIPNIYFGVNGRCWVQAYI